MSSHDFFSQADSQTLTNLKHIIKMNQEISNSLSTAINDDDEEQEKDMDSNLRLKEDNEKEKEPAEDNKKNEGK